MPGMQWPSIAAPLPPNHKKKSVTPGFTDAELLYLEEVLAVIDSMNEDSDSQHSHDLRPHPASHHHAPEETLASRSPSNSSIASTSTTSLALFTSSSTTSRLIWKSLRTRTTEAKLWALTHPSTLGIFLVFLATLLLSSQRSLVSIWSVLGAGCLGVGLKILAASEEQAMHLDPEAEPPRGRLRGRGKRSRRQTAIGQQ